MKLGVKVSPCLAFLWEMAGMRVILFAAVITALSAMWAYPLRAQEPGSTTRTVTLYVDRKTKQVFLEPGRNRHP